MAEEQTEQSFQINDKKQMLVLVRYKPAGAAGADAMLGGAASKVQGAVDKVEGMADSIPGLNLFFKEEKDPEKKCDKEYTYFKGYSAWDKYFNKMKDELVNKLNNDNETIVFDFDADDVKGRQDEGKKLFNKIKEKTGNWKDYTACFHFVGLGQGGNVSNECIKLLSKENEFKTKWWVQSVIYVATPLYKNAHTFDPKVALKDKGKIYTFGNEYDLTQNSIAYFEPNDQLLKIIAESNANLLSIFTGKIKTQLVSTLGRLLSIDGFGTGKDNDGNIDKLTQCKDDVKGLVKECVEACKNIANAFPGIVKPPDLPKFDQMLNGFDNVPDKSVQRLEKFIDEVKKARQGTSFDTKRVDLAKIFNFLCPLVDQLTAALQLFSFNSETSKQLFENLMEKAGVKKVLAPAETTFKSLPVDPYIEKVAEMAKKTDKEQNSGPKENKQTAHEATHVIQQDSNTEKSFYDQATVMIEACKKGLLSATKGGDVEINKDIPPETIQKIGEAITSMLLPMMPSKKKFYGTLLNYIPLNGIDSFLNKLTGDAAFAPLKSVLGKVKDDFDFDEGTDDESGLKKSIQNLDNELGRIKGFLNKNNYPINKDANSLYFIYNSHNIILKKPYGEIMQTIDKETGYMDYMRSCGYDNYYNLTDNGYRGKGEAKDNVQPAQVLEKKEQAA